MRWGSGIAGFRFWVSVCVVAEDLVCLRNSGLGDPSRKKGTTP